MNLEHLETELGSLNNLPAVPKKYFEIFLTEWCNNWCTDLLMAQISQILLDETAKKFGANYFINFIFPDIFNLLVIFMSPIIPFLRATRMRPTEAATSLNAFLRILLTSSFVYSIISY